MNKIISVNSGVALSALVSLGVIVNATSSTVDAKPGLVKETKTITLCDDLFEIDANADKKTAKERARIVQANLDNALLLANDRSPSAVQVRQTNGLPVVELDGFHIVTADSNSAKRNKMSKQALAEKWAKKIKFCLAKTAVVENYIAHLRGDWQKKRVAIKTDKNIAVVKPETKLPIHLITKFNNNGTTIGDSVTAVLSKSFPLPPMYKAYIPAGSLIHGKVVDTVKHTYNGFPKKNAVTIDFYSIEMPNGQDIPIQAHIVGGENKFFAAKNSRQKDVDTTLDAGKKPTGISGSVITGAWLGDGLTKAEASRLPRLVMDKGSTFNIVSGEKLQMQTTATTAISVATPKLATVN